MNKLLDSINSFICQTSRQVNKLFDSINSFTCQLVNSSTCKLVNLSTRQLPLMGTEYYCNKGDDRITIIQKKVQKTDLYFYP